MSNCLVTKLKGVVDNPNLLPIGGMKMYVKPIDPSQYSEQASHVEINVKDGETVEVTALNGGYFAETFAGLDDVSTRLTYIKFVSSSADLHTSLHLYFPNTLEFELIVTNKYAIRRFAGSNTIPNVFYLDIDELKYSKDLTFFTSKNNYTYGNISSFAGNTNLTNISIDNCPVSGDITSLASCSSLTIFGLSRCTNLYGSVDALGAILSISSITAADVPNITGTVDGFVANAIAAGRTTNTSNPVNIFRILQFGTFNGKQYSSENAWCYIAWESASKIAVYAGAYGYTSCPRVYCKGYTQQEAEAKWSGKTIIRVDA